MCVRACVCVRIIASFICMKITTSHDASSNQTQRSQKRQFSRLLATKSVCVLYRAGSCSKYIVATKDKTRFMCMWLHIDSSLKKISRTYASAALFRKFWSLYIPPTQVPSHLGSKEFPKDVGRWVHPPRGIHYYPVRHQSIDDLAFFYFFTIFTIIYQWMVRADKPSPIIVKKNFSALTQFECNNNKALYYTFIMWPHSPVRISLAVVRNSPRLSL